MLIATGNGAPPGFRLRRCLAGSVITDVSFGGGDVDYAFADGPGSDSSVGRALALQGGRIIAVGEAEWNAPDYDFGVMRIEASPILFNGFEVGSASAWSTVAP